MDVENTLDQSNGDAASPSDTARREQTLLFDAADQRLGAVHDFTGFLGTVFAGLRRRPWYFSEIERMCYEVGVKSLPLVTLTGIITGIVFTQQSRPSLQAFGAASWLPSLVTLALVRSLAPLVTALVCAGRVGSSIGAELGSMRVTEQIDAMEVSSVDPLKFLVATRTIATTLMVPILTAWFGLLGFLGAFINVSANEGTTWTAFVREAFVSLSTFDLVTTMVRAIAFGFIIGIVGCHAGYHAGRGTQGVGRAANAAVVRAMLAVFLVEVVIVQIVSVLRGML